MAGVNEMGVWKPDAIERQLATRKQTQYGVPTLMEQSFGLSASR